MISCNQNIFHEIINSFYLTKMITKAPLWHRDCKKTVILSVFLYYPLLWNHFKSLIRSDCSFLNFVILQQNDPYAYRHHNCIT